MSEAERRETSDSAEGGVERALGRNDAREAVRLCLTAHGSAIGRYASAMLGSVAEGEGVLRETLLAAHRAFEAELRGEESRARHSAGGLRTWLFSIARRRCARLSESRTRRAGVREPGGAADVDVAEPDASHRGDGAGGALTLVRPSEREALLLRYAAELSFREVAEVCGIDEPAARKRVSRGLATMRGVLTQGEADV